MKGAGSGSRALVKRTALEGMTQKECRGKVKLA